MALTIKITEEKTLTEAFLNTYEGIEEVQDIMEKVLDDFVIFLETKSQEIKQCTICERKFREKSEE